MKRSSIYKYDTVWLRGLWGNAIIFFIMFLLSTVSLAINVQYGKYIDTNGISSNQNLTFKGDSILFPILLVSTIIQVFFMLYCIWNFALWYQSYKKSYDKRKKFNFIALIFSGVTTILFVIDTFMKLLAVFMQIGVFFEYSPTVIIALGYADWPQVLLKPFIMFPISLVGFIFYTIYYLLQIHFFKSENHENALDRVQSNYRKIHVDKKRKAISKAKKDLSKKISVF